MPEPGSVLDLVGKLAAYRWLLATVFVLLPAVAWLGGRLLCIVSQRAAGWLLSVLIYLTVLPGIAMTMIAVYLMFFARDNILARYDAIILFGPIISMVLTLFAASRVLPFEKIPGFDRITGLMVMSALSMGTAYFFYQLAIRIWFFASLWTLLGLFVVVFVVFKLAAWKAFGRREEKDPA